MSVFSFVGGEAGTTISRVVCKECGRRGDSGLTEGGNRGCGRLRTLLADAVVSWKTENLLKRCLNDEMKISCARGRYIDESAHMCSSPSITK